MLLAALFGVVQFIRPAISINPLVHRRISGAKSVKTITYEKRFRYDCHSNETDLKWFDVY